MSHDVRIVRLYDGSPEAVFDLWVDADARKVWYAHSPDDVVEAETDLRVGGAWSVDFGRPGERYREHGTFLEIDRPHRVVYTMTFTFPDGRFFETKTTVEFVDKDGKTELTLLDAGYPDEATRRGHEQGWPGFLDRLADLLAS